MKRIWLVWIGMDYDREWLLEWWPTKAEALRGRDDYVRANLVDMATGVERFDRATLTKRASTGEKMP